MIPVRFKKILGDLKEYKSRYLLMIAALSLSLLAISIILGSYSILNREIEKNYTNTDPAHVTYEVENLSLEYLNYISGLEEVETLELRDAIFFQVRSSDGKWYGLRTFVVEDFNHMKLSRFYKNSGIWPPKTGEVLLERTVPGLIGIGEGESITIKLPSGETENLNISGTVHDPSLSPAWQEKTGYAYITRETYRELTGITELHDLKVLFNETKRFSHQEVKTLSRDLADKMVDRGVGISEIMVPPPYKHPHQGQIDAIMGLFILFGFLSIVLSGVLVSEMIATLMAKEIKQIGILKSIGAGRGQIFSLYITGIILISMLSILLGIIPGLKLGVEFAKILASQLNFTIYSPTIPGFVYLILICAGLLIPILLTFIPLFNGSRISIKQAINENGIRDITLSLKKRSILKLSSTMRYSLRNTFRRKGRLLLSLTLLSFAGGVFLTSRNVDRAWEQKLFESFNRRKWDLDIRLNAKYKRESINLKEYIEGINITTVTPYYEEELRISEIYPDGGHGVFYLKEIPKDTELFGYNILQGDWSLGNKNIVLNQKAFDEFPDSSIGDEISIVVDEEVKSLTLVGVIEEIGPATAYIGYAENSSGFNALMLQYADSSFENEQDYIKELEVNLKREGVGVIQMVPETMFREAINGHIYIIIYSLLVMGVILAVVGVLGLSSSITSNVLERKREFGILKTVGAQSGKILTIVLYEAFLTTLISIGLACLLSLPLSTLLGNMLGNMAFQTPLDLILSGRGLLSWILLIFISSTVTSLFPALTAVESTIKESMETE